MEQRGVRVLGTPLGTDQFVDSFCADTLDEKAQLLHFLPKLPSLQAAWLLLYFCAVPRVNHLLRTLPPERARTLAARHDQRILEVFMGIFGIPCDGDWDSQLHGLEFDTWVRQARLPLRLAGCGLRDSCRVSFSAYWASWADCVQDLVRRYPATGNDILTQLAGLQSLDFDQEHTGAECLVAAELASKQCRDHGFSNMPLWVDLAAGLRPPEPQDTGVALGEWRHGWQFHASDSAEKLELQLLMQALALPSTRSNAASPGKARLHSCMGPFASVWLTICPTTDALTFANTDFQCVIKWRLGIAVRIDGSEAHGYSSMCDNRGARLNARHSGLLAAWKQVLVEAGGTIPDRNEERMLINTHVPVRPDDHRRLDLIVPGLNAERGLPLFCDITVISPLTRVGAARAGTSNRGGSLLEQAQSDNDNTYHDVIASGLGALMCLGCEVFGRWGPQCIKLVPELAREKSRGLHPRIRRGVALSLQHRWWGILGVGLQKAVAHIILHSDAGADLFTSLLEPVVAIADLPVL
jgi:hypothetical protein